MYICNVYYMNIATAAKKGAGQLINNLGGGNDPLLVINYSLFEGSL